MSKKITFFPYHWHIEEDERNMIIHIFGLTKKGKSIHVIIEDFKPWVFVELPLEKNWTKVTAKMVGNKIDRLCGKRENYNGDMIQGTAPIKKEFTTMKKLYYASTNNKTFPFLKLFFSAVRHVKKFSWKLKRPVVVPGLGRLNLKCHEHNANPVIQLTSLRKLSTASWIECSGQKTDENSSSCDYEFIVKNQTMKKSKKNYPIPNPLVLSFDIEVNSTNPTAMPNAKKPGDKIFQISCILFKKKKYEKFLLTLGEPDPDKVGKDVEIQMFNTEANLLIGFTEFINEHNPQVVLGYNILGFDIPYMIERAKFQMVMYDFDQMGYIKFQHAKERLIKWSSSAYKNQEFQYLDAYGRLFIDLLPLIRRDYKLNKYNLKTVSTFFLGETKDPLSPQGIFKCYRLAFQGTNEKKGSRALGVVGKYCVQDSVLVAKLFQKLQIWIGLAEMATICNVPIFYLYTQGQQIKVFSQVYKKCFNEHIVVENDGYTVKDDEHYTGAHVFDPIPGLYENVVPFDFSSLYPSLIIAYNIDYSTIVVDESFPDEKCHVIAWEDHIGCEHDTVTRATKPKNIMCCKRRYRFLKEPMGIIPTLLKNLLDARSKTKKQIKQIKNDKTLITTLDKRQLAYKVSANSMYGAMGVRRGFLPFPPGAMCTTAQGRVNLEKAANILQKKFKGKLIYGDSVTGNTPIFIKDNKDKISIRAIEDLASKWEVYEEFKPFDSNRKDKQQSVINYKVWTNSGWSKIKRVIRHKTRKQIYRINTHCGCVDVTEDHSLLNSNAEQIKPKDCVINKTELLHNYPKFDHIPVKLNELLQYKTERTIKECEAFIYGFFFADGSCGEYSTKYGIKYTWALNKQNRELLELCKQYLKNLYNCEFVILETMHSSHVLKLVPKGEIKFMVKKFRSIFYNKYKNKIIPDCILNGNYNIRFNFFQGYLGCKCSNSKVKNIRFSNKGKLGSAQLYYLAKSIGYKASIQIRTDKLDIYRITLCCKKQRKNPNIIKKILNVNEIDENIFVYDLETEKGNFQAGIGEIIVKNTDSCYIKFQGIHSSEKLWDHCLNVEKKISKLFPPPMKLAFEEKIYRKFLILTKKRYMALWCEKDGVVSDKILKRGVLIARRDNSEFIRNLYKDIVLKLLYGKDTKQDILYFIISELNKLFSGFFDYKKFLVTKSIGNLENYKIRELHVDKKKRIKRMQDLKIYNYNDDKFLELGFTTWLEDDNAGKKYKIKCLPAHVQLAQKMRDRGLRVDAGSRLEYLVTMTGGLKAKQYEKIEDPKFQQRNSIKLDYYYYLHLLINPLDQVLNVVYKLEDFVKTQYKLRILKYKYMQEVKGLFTPQIKFIE